MVALVNLSSGIVAFGANLPRSGHQPWGTLRQAASIVHATPDISITALSRFWKSRAVPDGSGPDFVNAVALIRTTLDARAVLARLHDIEAQAGRDRSTGRWSARVLDLDLIALDDAVLPDPESLGRWMDLAPNDQARHVPDQLLLPHPRMHERAFVLAPLAEIAPLWSHPFLGKNTTQMLAALDNHAMEGLSPLELSLEEWLDNDGIGHH
ncbi:MAG: 2-amino-4-hydroxy-6-hydroxymethyldihydropteridine diphosphokinase [Paracoccus sp. (in: a-proteobacteria)]|nr:2-amino-4-hydroxy-6-hydroxymethyldihydropteridine diphosphokinase [Paracoccus sp. (in: a-proteobacteria)]